MKQRDLNKHQMAYDRGAFGSWPVCDYCQKRSGVEMHERIARSKTVGNEEARELSFQVELCNLLCQTCHFSADNQEVDHQLWMYSIRLYGMERVRTAFQKLQASMRTKLVVPELS